MLALRAAHASRVLAGELSTLLALDDAGAGSDARAPSPELPIPARADVVDLATVITKEMLGHALAP